MAEVVASAVGIAAFAIQTGEKIIKLVAFIESVKETPLEIKYLVREMNVSRLLLEDCILSADQLDGETTSVMRECKQLCLQSTEILGHAAEELHQDISKNKIWGSFKALTKRGMLNQLKERVRNATAMLHLSKQIYSESMQKQNNHVVLRLLIQQVEFQKKLESDPQAHLLLRSSSHSSLSEAHSRNLYNDERADFPKPSPNTTLQFQMRPGEKSQFGWNICIKAPAWLKFTARVLEIQSYRSAMACGFGFRVYNEVPMSSPAFRNAQNGNAQAIQQLFNSGLASPFDRTPSGMSLLATGAAYRKLNVCRMLLNLDTSTEIDRVGRIKGFTRLIWQGHMNSAEDIELLELLAQNGDLPDPFYSHEMTGNKHISNWEVFNRCPRGDARGLSWVMSKTKSHYFQHDTDERRRIILRLSAFPLRPDLASMVRFLLGHDKVNAALCQNTVNFRFTLLHCVARNLGEQYIHSPVTYERYLNKSWIQDSSHHNLTELLRLLQDLVRAGAKLHAIGTVSDTPRTPLALLIQSFEASNFDRLIAMYVNAENRYLKDESETRIAKVSVPLMIWLDELQKSGVDLLEYGRKEREIWSSHLISSIFEHVIWDEVNQGWMHSSYYSVLFTYGSQPGDWCFSFIQQLDDSFSEFWDMVDHPERAIPGSWVEHPRTGAGPPPRWIPGPEYDEYDGSTGDNALEEVKE